MATVFFSQLKSYCYELEQDSTKLRNQLNNPSKEIIFDSSYFDELQEKLKDYENILNEYKSCLNSSNSIKEIEGEMLKLYQTNQAMLSKLESTIIKYGYQQPSNKNNQELNKSKILKQKNFTENSHPNTNQNVTFQENKPKKINLKFEENSTKEIQQSSQLSPKQTQPSNNQNNNSFSTPTKVSLNFNDNDNDRDNNHNGDLISTPETPSISTASLRCFNIIQNPRTQAPPKIQLPESPIIIPKVDDIKSNLSSPDSDIPDFSTTSFHTTVLVKSKNRINSPQFEKQQSLQMSNNYDSDDNNDNYNNNNNNNEDDESDNDDDDNCNYDKFNDVQSESSNDELNEILNLSLEAFSPPKTSKILQPRKKFSDSETSDGWIPFITNDEWSKAPNFLKMQTNLQTINSSLEAINDHIKSSTSSTSSSSSSNSRKHIESLTTEELEQIISKKLLETPVKVLLMGLVHFKKLDICIENSIKVYTIRRYY